jgi:hypothetical protein
MALSAAIRDLLARVEWRRHRARLLLATALILAAAVLAGWVARQWVERHLRSAAAARGYALQWDRLHIGPLASAQLDGLRATRLATGELVLAAREAHADLDLFAALAGRARPRHVRLWDARITQPALEPEDTLAALEEAPAEEERPARGVPPLASSLRAALRTVTRDFTRLPRVELRHVSLVPRGSTADSLVVDSLAFDPRARRTPLAARGHLFAPVAVPFRAEAERLPRGGGIELRFDSDPAVNDDRAPAALRRAWARLVPAGSVERWHLSGEVEDLVLRDRAFSSRQMSGLRVGVDGGLLVQRRPARLELGDTTRISVGGLGLRAGFELDERGPVAGLRLRADGLTGERLRRELPPAVLGPLSGLVLHGSFDYRLDCRVDFTHLDEAALRGDVIPHGLWLDPVASRPSFDELEHPFTAQLHLPGGRMAERVVGPANPYFVPLAELPADLVSALLANEDAAFFQHRGFSLDAMREALAVNLRRGRFVRGAGTVTMQLVRNLYLGHERSLARKAQEVALTWLLENLTLVSKERLLEIYLNVIEWAPGVQGVGEAARFYFDKDARRLTLDEALFLTVVVPSPRLWRYRFDRETGALRRGARQQMHFIARAMVRKGWLAPERLPASPDDFKLELRGQAREILFPPPVPADSLGARPT